MTCENLILFSRYKNNTFVKEKWGKGGEKEIEKSLPESDAVNTSTVITTLGCTF